MSESGPAFPRAREPNSRTSLPGIARRMCTAISATRCSIDGVVVDMGPFCSVVDWNEHGDDPEVALPGSEVSGGDAANSWAGILVVGGYAPAPSRLRPREQGATSRSGMQQVFELITPGESIDAEVASIERGNAP